MIDSIRPLCSRMSMTLRRLAAAEVAEVVVVVVGE